MSRREAYALLRACRRARFTPCVRTLAPPSERARRRAQVVERYDAVEREQLGLLEPDETIRAPRFL